MYADGALRAGGATIDNALEVNGNVGIGTSPGGGAAFKLAVNGSAAKPGGGSWSTMSDQRLKHDIHDLEGALERILALRGVRFQYNDPKAINELTGEQIGMVAQEVEVVFSNWVDETDQGYKFVTFRGFEALTVEALRELRTEKDAQIESLKTENRTLRNEMNAHIESLRAEKYAENAILRARLETLERTVQSLAAIQNGGAR